MAFTGTVGHLEGIETPFCNTAGIVKNFHDLEVMVRAGTDMIEAGSDTIPQRYGAAYDPAHPEKGPLYATYHHDRITGETTNADQIPSIGFDALIEELPERLKLVHGHNKKYIQNIGLISDNLVDEAVEAVGRLNKRGIDALLLSGDCPTIGHERLTCNPQLLAKVLQAIGTLSLEQPIFLRISPQDSFGAMNLICSFIKTSKIVSGIFVTNTQSGFRPVNKAGEPYIEVNDGYGGRSGPATFQDTCKQLFWAELALRDSNIDIVASQGIMTGADVARVLELGAVAAGGTTFFRESQNGWAKDVDRLLVDLAGKS